MLLHPSSAHHELHLEFLSSPHFAAHQELQCWWFIAKFWPRLGPFRRYKSWLWCFVITRWGVGRSQISRWRNGWKLRKGCLIQAFSDLVLPDFFQIMTSDFQIRSIKIQQISLVSCCWLLHLTILTNNPHKNSSHNTSSWSSSSSSSFIQIRTSSSPSSLWSSWSLHPQNGWYLLFPKELHQVEELIVLKDTACWWVYTLIWEHILYAFQVSILKVFMILNPIWRPSWFWTEVWCYRNDLMNSMLGI